MSDTNEHRISHADVPICFTSNLMEMTKRLITVVKELDRETVVRKVVRNIGLESFIDGLRSFDSGTFEFRGPREFPLKDLLNYKTENTHNDQLKAGNQTNGISQTTRLTRTTSTSSTWILKRKTTMRSATARRPS